ncbi:MAG: hypothetical protein JWM52_616 [Candidatus Saccharibacteria bacterium]|nr:hypothetical protein [Candidatus Saccharibacteria bacterium]
MHLHHVTGFRLFISVLFGAAATVLFLGLSLGGASFLLGWDSAVALFILWTWLIIWPMGHTRTAEFARREDPSRVVANVIFVLATIATLAGVIVALFVAHSTTDTALSLFLTLIGIVSVVVSWVLIHTIFALRYARIYYDGTVDTIQFERDHQPTFSDFAYLAFTLGMTYQVSDNQIVGSGLRKTVLRHTLFSYVFGTVIVAITVNLIVDLGR